MPQRVKLVAVSKFHSLESILEAAEAGQFCFAESRPQEFFKKIRELQEFYLQLYEKLEWQSIGHLQTNKLKLVLPYASLIESIDSLHLLKAVDEWGKSAQKLVKVLLELHIASESSKQSFLEEEDLDILFDASKGKYSNVQICGLMGMTSFTDNEELIRDEFGRISAFFNHSKELFPEWDYYRELSIDMSGDWKIAIEYGATIVRLGTAIFRTR